MTAPGKTDETAGPSDPAAELVSLADMREAAARLRGIAVRTPLLPFGPPIAGDPRGRTRVYLKPESLQPIGAFKIRGAYNAIALLPPDVRARGVVTHSSGNHAQGVARAARLLGTRAVIVMPSDASRLKVERVLADGAEIVTVGPSSDERAERAHELAASRGLTLIPPYDDRAIVAGQGTIGLEIAEQLHEFEDAPEPTTVLVPIGGGGLAAGVATALKSLRPDCVVLGVEPELAADARESLAAGRIVRWRPEEVARTSADGMRTASLGRIPFAHLARYLDGVLLVSEVEIARAMARAAQVARLVLEPSGATTLAAVLFRDLDRRGRIVAVLSGGNVDPARYAALVEEGIAAGG